MSDKKPAHVVVVEMIRETIGAISKIEHFGPPYSIQIGRLSAELGMLQKMVVPEKHREEVIASLRQIKESCSLENIEELLPNTVFLAIAPSTENPEA